jgi:hypothetical protein
VYSSTYGHTGLLRSNPSGAGGAGTWYLFSNMTTEPSANTVATNVKTVDTLVAYLSGTVTGNSTTATTLQTSRNFTATGDVTTDSVQSFNGSNDVALPLTIGSNKVTYGKLQQVAASSVVGNSTGTLANAQSIPASVTGFALLSASSAAAGGTTLGLGTGSSVTFNNVTINNSSVSTNSSIYNGSITGNNNLTITTFNKTTYNTVKYVVQIKRTDTTRSAACEILVNYNTATSAWDGTVYGILDSNNILTNVDVSTSGSTIDLAFTFNGNGNYTVLAAGQAL